MLVGWSGIGSGSNNIAAVGTMLVPQAMPVGLGVTSLRTDGAAARAGLRVGDVTDEIDSRDVPSSGAMPDRTPCRGEG